jgi:hypothetical protein
MPAKTEPYPTTNPITGVASDTQTEFGRPVEFVAVEVDSGTSFTWSVTYVVPGAVPATSVRDYRIDYLPQPMFFAMPISISVTIPKGTTFKSSSPGTKVNGQTITWSGSPAAATSIDVTFG